MPSNLPFTVGVEIEFEHANLELDLARYSGIPWTSLSGWTLKTDASCGKSPLPGYEICSPVLHTDLDLEMIRRATKILKESSAKLNERCGLHVHVGLPDEDVHNLLTFLVRYEGAFFALANSDRQSNTFCRKIQSQVVEGLLKGLSFDAWSGIPQSRYQWLNGESFYKHGTLEFRVMESSFDADFIIGWIDLILQVCSAKMGKGKHKAGKSRCESGEFLLHDMLQQIKCYGSQASERAIRVRKWAAERFSALHGYSYRTFINAATRKKQEEKLQAKGDVNV